MPAVHSRIVFSVFFLLATAPVAHAQTQARVSVGTGGIQSNAANGIAVMTPDGRYIAFVSSATNLTPENRPGVFRHDRLSATTTYVAFGSAPSMSDDGQFIAFGSTDSTLVPNDTNGRSDIFIWSAADGSFQRATAHNQLGQIGGQLGQISGDGRYVAFATQPGSSPQNFVFDRVLQTHASTGFAGMERLNFISADGRYVAFTQMGDTLAGDTNGRMDVYRVDRQTNTTSIVSTTAAGAPGSGDSQIEGMSADGRYVLLVSWSPNFPGTRAASPITWDLFLKDVQTGALTQVNVNGSGQRFDVMMNFDLAGHAPTLSANGRFVVFSSRASNVVAGDTNGLWDTFLYDRDTVAFVRVSVPEGGGEAVGGRSGSGMASSDGRYVAFESFARNLVPGDTNFEPDVFVRDGSGAPPCAVTVSPSGLAVISSAGGNGTINVTAPSSCAWTATVNAPWIRTTGVANGVGDGAFSYAFDPYAGTTIRSAAIVVNTAAYGVRQLGATVTQPPFGTWETPVPGPGGVTNVSGAIPFTGWALDDVQVTRIRIYRGPVAGEGSAEIFVGDAVQVAGARPDVVAAHPSLPYNTSAGWGLMVLTNMLPNQGNGVFTFYVYYDDADGHTRLAGTRTLTATNATASVPFGTIDTPGQGQTVSGTIVNFGWALTPQPGSIPSDGSTIDVFIDGVNVGHPSYGHFRSDIATLFPGYANTNGAVGHFTINTASYADGVHTIAWVVADNLGRASGIGSRYFTIQNGSTPVTPPFARGDAPQSAARSAQPILRIVGDGARWIAPDAAGVYDVRVRGLDRLELRLDPWHGPGSCARFTAATLPAGASLDARSGTLVWQPAAGVGGTHDIRVDRTSCGGTTEAIAVRVTFDPR